ncbi:hypothetical protein [Iamia sp.]|uniref:hypothetical protein n=1 Tax=Iamia sp. TaxID=2722710 RepID=UPI002CA2A12B|nr:hypothetical protein [Iamia sp.]HXH56300.1 hypothetical protein [Iamia sp.]
MSERSERTMGTAPSPRSGALSAGNRDVKENLLLSERSERTMGTAPSPRSGAVSAGNRDVKENL